MVHDKDNFFQHYRLPAFPSREWLSDLFFGEQLQTSQASVLPVLSTDALRNMRNVKFLQLNYMKFYGSYEHFPKNLIWLCWHGFYLRSLPKHLCLEKVVVLDLSRSCLVDAWKGKLLENHQGHRFLESDACAASTPSIIRSLSLKLLFPSRFSARKAPRFTLPHSLTRLDLSGTPIRFLPESIKDLSPLVALTLRNCQMLKTLPELPSNLSSLDVSSSYSLQRVPNLIPWTVVYDCDQLADIQDWVKLELIQKADSHMFRILESVNAHIQPWIFQVSVLKGVFNVAVSDEDGMVKFYEEEEEEWIIQKEFVGHLSFQIASPAVHRICAFNLFIRFRTTRETRLRGSVNIEIRNNTSGRSLFCPASFFPSGYRHGNGVIQSLSHWKLGVEDPTFDNGDDVSISVLSLDPTIQVMMVGILWLHEEEGNGDGDKIQSNNKVVTSHCSSSSNREVSATHNSIDADDDVHLAKAEIASRIFRNFSCSARYNPGNLEVSSWLFEKKGIMEKQEMRIFLASCMFDSAVRYRS
ncbi:LEUCINE-RICH REPEAT-CONTAINING PROTEIN [Salix viminalis]|uniref:LEUCINE-RICH REPEAT-CONTAINING PROTEIN n=1 Tax=Salix viminalis TaxID=40686 RepID=A0A9Q0Z8K2_SALVM|nr:LEUCINE-RICH REPEAT-CONTAINING PROTEIN [Salix viminalis]